MPWRGRYSVAMLAVGSYELHAIESGHFRLDGGAMFGVVPKVLWAPLTPPDALNRIGLAMRCLVAIDRRAGRVILVDSGAGQKWTEQENERFAFSGGPDPLGAGLSALGIHDQDITDVVVTHLHFDHNGGLTRWEDDPGTRAVPRFGNAVHWLHAGHLAHARQPGLKDRASFYGRDFEPLLERELFRMVDGRGGPSPLPGVSWLVANGHTPCQLLPRFEDDHLAVQFVADLIPTTAHLPPPWVMAYDNEPLKTIAEKQALYRECAAGDLLLFFEHDPEVAAARIDVSGRRPALQEPIAM